MPGGQHTLHEILSQPDIWVEALTAVDPRDPLLQSWLETGAFDHVIVTGCGSSYYLALTAARLLRQAGRHALACPASELLLHRNSIRVPGHHCLLLTVSRSGVTSETTRAQLHFKHFSREPVVTVTCDSSSSLARSADLAMAIDAAQEASVAQTRSFTSMLVVIQQLVAMIAGQDLAASRPLVVFCRHLLERYDDLARSLGENSAIKKFFFLGSNELYGIACGAMLKMKVMSLSYSEAYHTLEFRHGPMSMVGEDSLVIGLISPEAAKQEVRVLDEMAEMGAKVLSIGPTPADNHPCVRLPADLPSWSMPVLHLPVLQLLAYYRALHLGHDPDQPQHLSAVISLDDL